MVPFTRLSGSPANFRVVDLDGNFHGATAPITIKLGIARLVHFAHAAGTQGRKDFVRTEFISGRLRHVIDLAKCS